MRAQVLYALAEGVAAGLDTGSVLTATGLATAADSELLLSEDAGTDAGPADPAVSVLASVGKALFLPVPSLKSVTYQPVPLS